VILVDTSIWVDHLRVGNTRLARFLEQGAVLGHPWVSGELALGNLGSESEVLRLLQGLPPAVVASHDEVLELIVRERLAGTGVGYVDAQLLAAARLTPDARLWAGERRLGATAARLNLALDSGEESPSADTKP
jgi:predicted nucleic acid-binding protein